MSEPRKFPLPFALVAVMGLATALRLIGLTFPFGDYDEGVYLATVRSVLHGFPLISQTYYTQGPLFIYLAEVFYRISPTITSVRLFPVLCSLAAIWSAFSLVDRYYGRAAAIFTSAYLSVDAAFLMVSRTFQADIPWVSFSFTSFCLLLAFHRTQRRWYVIGSAILFALGICIKTNPLLIPVIVAYFLLSVPSRGIRHAGNIGWYALTTGAVLLATVPVQEMPAFYTDVIGLHSLRAGLTMASWTGPYLSILLGHEWPLMCVDVISVVMLIMAANRERKRMKAWVEDNLMPLLAVLWLAATTVAFTFYKDLFPHHFVFFILPAALLAGYGVSVISGLLRGSRPVTVVLWLILLGICGYSGSYTRGSDVVQVMPHESDYDQAAASIAKYVDTVTGPEDYVVADNQIILYLANRPTPPDLVDTSSVRIDSGVLTDSVLTESIQRYQPAVIVLVSGRLSKLPNLMNDIGPDYTLQVLPNGAAIFQHKR